MSNIDELDEWLSGRTAKAERSGRSDQGNQSPQQHEGLCLTPELLDRLPAIGKGATPEQRTAAEGVASRSDTEKRTRPLPSGATPTDETKRTRRSRISDRIRPDALSHQPNPTQEEEVEVTPQLVQQRMKLAEKLNTIYTSFSETREKKRNDALRMLARDLARLGGSISACGMTGEVKEFVMTLLMLEKVLPTGESGEDLGVNPTQMISDWLNGKGELTGEFDSIEGGK